MLNRALIWIAWIGILSTTIHLRINDLGDRPIHADEATGARILAERLEAERYAFDPTHFHGPIQSIVSEPIARIRKEFTWQDLSIETLRIGPVIAGVLLALTPLLWTRNFGIWPTTLAAAFIGTSPLLVYYSRMFIHESWLALFGMIAAPAVFALIKYPSKRVAAIAAGFIGLMFATKETFAISVLSWSLAGLLTILIIYPRDQYSRIDQLISYWKPVSIGIFTTLSVGAVFYTNYFQNPGGLIDAFVTFFVYETTPGHDKPFLYYFEFLLWPKLEIGLVWSEGLLGLIAVFGCIHSIKHRNAEPAAFFLSISLGVHWIIYCLISYKTPWLMLLPWAHAAILAGYAIKPLISRSKRSIAITLLISLFCITYQIQQSIAATGRLANDPRNPYAYVPTSKDPERIELWIEKLMPLDPEKLNPTAVVGNGYWPLPWYLRKIKTIGYWPQTTEGMRGFPLVFATPSLVSEVDSLLSETHAKLPRALRSNVPVIMYLRNDLWDEWIRSSEP
ncbi:MAG: flippase activity-associated protein Agl23 [Verrucomicrobiota bacterium]